MKNNKQRAKTAIILVGVVIGILSILTLLSTLIINVLVKFNSGDLSIVEQNDLISQYESQEFMLIVISLLHFVIYITSTVTFIMWFRRAYANLHKITTKPYLLSHSEGWAAGSWFVPILNLFRPYQIMEEIRNNYNELLIDKELSGRYNPPSNGLIVSWWFFWIFSGIFNRVASFMSNSENFDMLIAAAWLEVGVYIFFIISGILVIQIILKISKMETLLYDHSNFSKEHINNEFGDILDSPI